MSAPALTSSRNLQPGRVTVLIPAHNRADHLKHTLDTVVPVLPGYARILVVDDASEGPSIADACAPHAHKVDYIRTRTNLGVIGARNYGVSQITTEFVIHLDDDSYFWRPDFIDETIALFRGNPQVAIIAYNICDNRRLPKRPTGGLPYLARTYVGCGNAWRMSAILEIGAFYEGFWRQGEELEHSMRAYDAGFSVLAVPGMLIQHDESALNRDPRRHLSLEAANYLKRIALRVPARYLPYMVARWLAFVCRHRRGLSLRQIWRELGPSPRSLAQAVRHRAPIRASTFRLVERLKREEALLFAGAGGGIA